MAFDRRHEPKPRKFGPFFYAFAIGIFSVITVTTLFLCIMGGFTEQRIAVLFLNAWFTLFTMDLVTVRFRRTGERAPWHDWAAFRREDDHDEAELALEKQRR